MDFYRPPSLQEAVDSLGAVYRALRCWKFYPKGHPARHRSMDHAYAAMCRALNGNNLSIACGSKGFSFPDGEKLEDNTRMSISLSYELFIRRIQRVTFTHDLFMEDLLNFIQLIALPPETILKRGGAEKIMGDHGVRSIWSNEFDLSIIRAKRQSIESKGIVPRGMDDIEDDDTPILDNEFIMPQTGNINPDQELHVLIGRLATTLDEEVYLMLARQAITCADLLRSRQELSPLAPLAELFTSHVNDPARSKAMREYADFALEQLALGNELLIHIFAQMEVGAGLSKDGLQAVLAAGGPSACLLAVEQMAVTNNLAIRKALSTALSRLGEQAVPALLTKMGDSRWFIKRNLSAILGAIGSRAAIPDLINCLKHNDIRVCKEAMRSLALIGGQEAESALISILRSSNNALLPQAIASLGGLKSKKALPELLKIVFAEDLFLKTLPLKIEAISAIAMIGDQQVTPHLLELLGSRKLVATARWRQLQIAIIHCLGKLGDMRAVPLLKKIATGSGEFERTCADVADLIERTGR